MPFNWIGLKMRFAPRRSGIDIARLPSHRALIFATLDLNRGCASGWATMITMPLSALSVVCEYLQGRRG
ncbi:hypothetical protein KCP76_20240 [Salmonella enterica subsp. enterica serovar Weltevreden]|nr:hypothetical protein KCP76_20240 [Salmonella enterica subsp. enterica serovar Weltevreden]